MSQPVVNAIERALNASLRAVREQTTTLNSTLAPVAKLPEMLGKQNEQLLQGIYDSMRAQVTLAIAEHRGQLAGKEERIREELRLIDEMRADAEERAGKLLAEAKQKVADALVELQRMVESIDGPVIELGRGVFPAAVQDRLANSVLPNWQLTNEAGSDSVVHRAQAFVTELTDLAERIERYRDDCRALRERAQRLACDGDAPPDTYVPVVGIEYERDGHVQIEFIIAPEHHPRGSSLTAGLPWLQDKLDTTFTANEDTLFDQMEECMTDDFSGSRDDMIRRYGHEIVRKRNRKRRKPASQG